MIRVGGAAPPAASRCFARKLAARSFPRRPPALAVPFADTRGSCARRSERWFYRPRWYARRCMDLGLRGKTAIVAAASKGLGKGVARALAAEGANVVMFSRDEGAILAAASEVQAACAGAQVIGLAADVTRPADLERVVETTVERFGGVDILFNNAG